MPLPFFKGDVLGSSKSCLKTKSILLQEKNSASVIKWCCFRPHSCIKGETYSSEKIYLLPCLFCYPYSVQSMTFKVWHYVIQQKRRATAPEQKSDSFFLSVLWCLQSIVFCKNVFRSLKKVFTGCVMTWAPALREECLKKRSRLAKLQKALKSVRLWRLSWGVLKLYRGKKETNVS